MRSAVLLLMLLVRIIPAEEQAPRAQLVPPAVEVGEPFALAWEVAHAPLMRVEPVEPDLDPTAPWVFLGASKEALAEPALDGAARSRLVWRFAALEPGSPAPPAVIYRWRDATGTHARELRDETLALEVRGLLGEGEDSPRPLAGLRPPPATTARPSTLPWILGALAAAGAALASHVIVTRRRLGCRTRPALEDHGALPWAALEQAPARTQGYELSRRIRVAFDRRVGVDRRGLTDEEWERALAADASLPESARAAAAEALRGLAGVKYAGERPTEFARREALERARAALAAAEVSA
jgi:hypothetical protein